MREQELKDFIMTASIAGYASGQEGQWIKEADGSTSIFFDADPFKYHDNYFGGEPYGGRTVIFYNSKPVWMMLYYGAVIDGAQTKQIYSFLRNALKLTPKEAPFRGPSTYAENDYVYTNSWKGSLQSFSGEEIICAHNQKVYQANYFGGFVDQRAAI